MSKNSAVALISSDYINAISIWSSLKQLKFEGKVIFLNTSGRNMVGSIWPNAEVIPFFKKDPSELLAILESLDPAATKFLFLTNELFHPLIHANREQLDAMNVVFHIGNSDPQTILDKSQFLGRLRHETDVPVPEEYEVPGKKKFPLMVKFRRSFEKELHTPKPRRIDNEQELTTYLAQLRDSGFSDSNIQLQELLSSETMHNVSVCGWYDSQDHRLFQTRKVIQHPPKIGNGDVVEVLPLDPTLEQHTLQVCKTFNYEGPFELEFIRELNGSQYKVIEMNPRFWMQHGLVEEISGHYLVAKYLNTNPISKRGDLHYWIYPMVSIYKALLLQFKYLPYLFRRKVYWPVNAYQATKFLVKHLASKFS